MSSPVSAAGCPVPNDLGCRTAVAGDRPQVARTGTLTHAPSSNSSMPYELSFPKQMDVANTARYINDCCIGGDVVSAALLPALQARYVQVDTGAEDWGWFIWSTRDRLRLAVDIFTDDYRVGRFRARVATSRRGPLFGWKEIDTAELEELKQIVHAQLSSWLGVAPLVAHVT